MPTSPVTTIPEWAGALTQGDLFCSGPWFRHFAASALRSDERPHFIEVAGRTAEQRLALALKQSRGEAFPFCRLLESMVSYYSCGFGPIGASSADPAALRRLADELALGGRVFDAVKLGPLDRDSPFAAVCQQALGEKGMRTYWTLAFRNWYAPTEGLDYAQYLKGLASTFPAISEKRRQAFLRKGIGTTSVASAEADLQSEIDAYDRVYAASWKVPEPFPQFTPGLIRLAAKLGWLRLGIARVGGEPAAAQLWFVVDGRALIYKVAYDERFTKLSVGSILTCALLDHVITEDGVREVDFLSGDDPYKAKWMMARRDRHNLWAFNPRRWRGLLGALRESVSQERAARA